MTWDWGDYRDRVAVADGDFLLEMAARGWSDSAAAERANVSRPELVRDVADLFLDAGAEVLRTNTAGVAAWAWRGVETDAAVVTRVYQAGAAVCRAAVDERSGSSCRVVGVMGPPGGLKALDELDDDALAESYAAGARALADGGVDAIALLGFVEIEPLCLAVQAAADAVDLPIIAGMVFDRGPEWAETTMGVTAPQACATLADAGAQAVVCDAGEHPDGAAGLVAVMRRSCDLPIWATVAAGVPELHEGRIVYPETPQAFAGRLAAIVSAGATFIAGGRGASSDHVAAMAAAHHTGKRRP